MVLLVAVAFFSLAAAAVNDRPIVGILTQPTDGGLVHLGDKYIAASYVKYVEAAGCRVVPVFHNSSMEELDRMFSHINGVLFPGGASDIRKGSPLRKAGERLLQNAIKAYDRGDYFPVFAHCLGFEMVSLIVSQDDNLLSRFDAEDIPLPLNFAPEGLSSRWIQGLSSNVQNILAKEPVTMNNHVFGISYPTTYENNTLLTEFFQVISTNQGREGKTFISTMEGRKYPVYGAQWHAEKNQYEWNPKEDIPHSDDAILAMSEFSTFLGAEARKSNHSFPTPEDAAAAVIYNYPPYYTEHIIADFEQCYVWGSPTI